MPIEFTEYRQVGTEQPPLYFERALMELALRCGRPLPELKGVRLERPEDSELSWLVVCTVRGREVAPVSEEFTVDVMERSWVDGMVRVMQEAIARLAFLHPEKIVGTPFQFVGQRDTEGIPAVVTPHPQFEHQMQHLEYLLHHSQTYMDRARMRSEMQEMEIQSLRAELEDSQKDLARERKMRRTSRKRIASLKDTVAALTAQTAEMESRIEELEEEGDDLRKENEAFLSDDDDYDEDMDMEPDTEDEDFINDEEEDPEVVISEEEEDPEEPPFDEDVPEVPVYPVVDLSDA